MTNERDGRPDPDHLLRTVNLAEGQKPGDRGMLKIFLGYCAGVGKTCRMLQQARIKKDQGWKVAIGVVETHGRSETAVLAEGIDVITPKTVDRQGIKLHEMQQGSHPVHNRQDDYPVAYCKLRTLLRRWLRSFALFVGVKADRPTHSLRTVRCFPARQ